jgi:hypothetical protein
MFEERRRPDFKRVDKFDYIATVPINYLDEASKGICSDELVNYCVKNLKPQSLTN